MKSIMCAAAIACLSVPAIAGDAWVPTGVDVPGSVYYSLENRTVIQKPCADDYRCMPIKDFLDSLAQYSPGEATDLDPPEPAAESD